MDESARDSAGLSPDYAVSTRTSAPQACSSAASWLRFLIPAVLGVAADLVLKAWSFPDGVPTDPNLMRLAGRHPSLAPTPDFGFAAQPPIPIIPHVLGFTTTVNQGAVFGIGQGKVTWFLAFSILALFLIVWVFLTSLRRQWVVHLALGLITAGAVGNLYDRSLYHGVRDMLQFYVSWYPYIFNVADALLCIGVPILIARWLFVNDSTAPDKRPL